MKEEKKEMIEERKEEEIVKETTEEEVRIEEEEADQTLDIEEDPIQRIEEASQKEEMMSTRVKDSSWRILITRLQKLTTSF